MRIKILSLIACVLPLLIACQAAPRHAIEKTPTRPDSSRKLVMPEGQRYVVLPRQSEVRFVVFPDGPLARMGHPHVIGGPAIGGEVVLAEPFHDSGLELTIAVRELELDRPEWRADEDFDPEMSPTAIEETRDNMLSEGQLDADNHPYIQIGSLGLNGPRWQPDIDLRITVAGVSRELTVPVALWIDHHELIAIGRFVIRQSDFGIEPFSAAGGSLRVADELLVRFRILAAAID